MPYDTFKKYWNVTMIFCLIYVAIFVPYNICFSQFEGNDDFHFHNLIDLVVDCLFGIDIFVNFLSSYEDPYTGLTVVNLKDIARNYISGWFTFDLFATMPL